MVKWIYLQKLSHFAKFSEEWYLAEYLKYGGVEAVLSNSDEYLPISIPEYHRLVKRRGIIKGDGRSNTSLAETLYVFLKRALEPTISLEKIYKKVPLDLRTLKSFPTLPTMYRIYDSVLKDVTRRTAVGLVITPSWSDEYVLLADEVESKLSSAKTAGDSTIPLGFVSGNQSLSHGILRVLQREFSTKMALAGGLDAIVPTRPRAFLEFQILDIKLQMVHIRLPKNLDTLKECTSFTVENHRFVHISEIFDNNSLRMRTGMREVLSYYKNYLSGAKSTQHAVSSLNLALKK